MGFIRDWWILVWWGEAVMVARGMLRYVLVKFGAAGSLQRTGGVYKGLVGNGFARQSGLGSVLCGYVRCGRKFAEDWTGCIWYGKMGFGSRGV